MNDSNKFKVDFFMLFIYQPLFVWDGFVRFLFFWIPILMQWIVLDCLMEMIFFSLMWDRCCQ